MQVLKDSSTQLSMVRFGTRANSSTLRVTSSPGRDCAPRRLGRRPGILPTAPADRSAGDLGSCASSSPVSSSDDAEARWRLIVRNSWGPRWGDGGFAYASDAYAASAFDEAYGAVL